MCQAAPLPRCSNHALKAKAEIEQTISDNNERTLELSRSLVQAKRDARNAGFTAEQIMDNSTPGLEHIKKIREDHAQLEREQMSLGRDIAEQELHIDATPKGKKALEEDENAAYRGFRLKNVRALNEWHKRIRATTDSNGVRIVDKDADAEQRKIFLSSELSKARRDYNNAVDAMKFFDTNREKLNEEAFKHEARTVGLNDPEGRRFGTWVAKEGSSPEEQEEVEHLSRQKSSVMTGIQQAHHDQILARAKMNSTLKAITDDKKRAGKKVIQEKQKADAEAGYAAARVANREHAERAVEDLKEARLKLHNYARGYDGTMEESLRLSAKASAVGDAGKLFDTYREMSHGDDGKAINEFRTELSRRKDEVAREAEAATSATDKAMYRGAQGGFALVLDKVRGV